jgi:NAD-dependent dihydropyrimidine dehydrogenase PreA subunit
MLDLTAFYTQFGVWPMAQPYVGRMFSEPEIRLVLALGPGALTASQLAEPLGLAPEAALALAERCYHRLIVNKAGAPPEARYSAADFYTFLDYFIKYDAWDDLPREARLALDAHYRALFVDKVRAGVEKKMAGGAVPGALPNDAVLLLAEAEAMLGAATEIVVEPCDCRRARQACERPVETCLKLDDEARAALARGHGRALSRAEAQQLVRRADQKGLMHTADAEWRAHGLHSLCNCCADDCYPFGAAHELGSKGVWPQSRYVAEYAAGLCSACGACVGRCHFSAFYYSGVTVRVQGKERRAVAYDARLCWGCGLCANTCPTGAIAMRPLPAASPESL